jgi:hypothetical protein
MLSQSQAQTSHRNRRLAVANYDAAESPEIVAEWRESKLPA